MTGIPKVGKEDSQADWPLWSIMSLRACWQRCIHACLAAQLCLTFCDPMDCHPPGSSVHGILQARILEWVAIFFSKWSSQPSDQTQVSCIGRWILYHLSHQGNPYNQGYGFSHSHVWMWQLDHKEGWAPRTDAFRLWCWRRLLIIPWIARSNQSILKKINPEYSLEGLMLKLKLKLQYFGHLMQRTDSLEETLMLGKIEGMRRRGRQRMR